MRRPTHLVRRALAVALPLAGIALASPAGATVACSYDAGTHEVSVTLDGGETVSLTRSGDAIAVNGSNCDTATVDNTNRVVVDPSATGVTVEIDLSGGPFAPGYTTEASGVSEIEFQGDLLSSEVTIVGSSANDAIVIGTAGVNLNAAEGSGDADVTFARVTGYTVLGGEGNDVVRGDGGQGTGNPSAIDAVIDGGDGDDLIAGTTSSDDLTGGAGVDVVDYAAAKTSCFISLKLGTATTPVGTDTLDTFENVDGSPAGDTIEGTNDVNVLRGLGSNDVILGLGGGDVLVGGPGVDEIDFSKSDSKVIVNLARKTARGEGQDVVKSFEDVTGTRFGDRMSATGRPNRLNGAAGSDTIVAKGGDDYLVGDDGDDTLKAGSGNDTVYAGDGRDSIDGGTGFDSCPTSPGGDTRRGCEVP